MYEIVVGVILATSVGTAAIYKFTKKDKNMENREEVLELLNQVAEVVKSKDSMKINPKINNFKEKFKRCSYETQQEILNSTIYKELLKNKDLANKYKKEIKKLIKPAPKPVEEIIEENVKIVLQKIEELNRNNLTYSMFDK